MYSWEPVERQVEDERGIVNTEIKRVYHIEEELHDPDRYFDRLPGSEAVINNLQKLKDCGFRCVPDLGFMLRRIKKFKGVTKHYVAAAWAGFRMNPDPAVMEANFEIAEEEEIKGQMACMKGRFEQDLRYKKARKVYLDMLELEDPDSEINQNLVKLYESGKVMPDRATNRFILPRHDRRWDHLKNEQPYPEGEEERYRKEQEEDADADADDE
jgi:hypothetical protein